MEGSENVGREVGTWDKEGKAAGKRCIIKAATTMGSWSLILQRISPRLHNTHASNVFLLRVKGSGVFMTQLPLVIDCMHSCKVLLPQYFWPTCGQAK